MGVQVPLSAPYYKGVTATIQNRVVAVFFLDLILDPMILGTAWDQLEPHRTVQDR